MIQTEIHFAIPAIMAAAVGDYLGVTGAANAFVVITVIFAIGQTIGPGAAGMIAGMTGTFTTTFLLSAALTVGAALLAASLPSPHHARNALLRRGWPYPSVTGDQ